jgi:uncharacterized membrane protein
MEKIGLNEIYIFGGKRFSEISFFKTFVKILAWSACLFFIFFFLSDAFGKYIFGNEESFGPYWQKKYWLNLHIIGGTLALVIGPVQFSAFIRNRFRRAHRLLGRFYVAGVGLGAIGSLYLSTQSVISWTFGAALFTVSIFWIVCTTMAVISIRRGRVVAHRQWMIRSYLGTFGFVAFRFLAMTPLFADAPLPERATTLVWLSFVVPLAIAEFIFQWKNSVAPIKNIPAAEGNF